MSEETKALNLYAPLDLPGLEPVAVEVDFGGKKYVLREASEEAAIAYKDFIAAASKLNDNGKLVGVSGVSGSESLLVSKCLFELYEHGGAAKERPVLLSVVRSWPSRRVRPLFDRVMAISEIWGTKKDSDKKDDEPAKNEPSATTDTSV